MHVATPSLPPFSCASLPSTYTDTYKVDTHHAYVMYIADRNATTSRHFHLDSKLVFLLKKKLVLLVFCHICIYGSIHLDSKLVPKIVTQQVLEDSHE